MQPPFALFSLTFGRVMFSSSTPQPLLPSHSPNQMSVFDLFCPLCSEPPFVLFPPCYLNPPFQQFYPLVEFSGSREGVGLGAGAKWWVTLQLPGGVTRPAQQDTAPNSRCRLQQLQESVTPRKSSRVPDNQRSKYISPSRRREDKHTVTGKTLNIKVIHIVGEELFGFLWD